MSFCYISALYLFIITVYQSTTPALVCNSFIFVIVIIIDFLFVAVDCFRCACWLPVVRIAFVVTVAVFVIITFAATAAVHFFYGIEPIAIHIHGLRQPIYTRLEGLTADFALQRAYAILLVQRTRYRLVMVTEKTVELGV